MAKTDWKGAARGEEVRCKRADWGTFTLSKKAQIILIAKQLNPACILLPEKSLFLPPRKCKKKVL